MLDLSEIRARAKRAVSEEFPDGPVYGSAACYCATSDVPALCDEVEAGRGKIKAMESDKINAEMNLENLTAEVEGRNTEVAALQRALEMAEDMLTKMTPFKSKGGWHDKLIERAREEMEK